MTFDSLITLICSVERQNRTFYVLVNFVNLPPLLYPLEQTRYLYPQLERGREKSDPMTNRLEEAMTSEEEAEDARKAGRAIAARAYVT
jgi:hypothetical protein